ncbi:MAG: protease modulator HflC [Desulfomonilaceae bacterium]
MARLSIVVIVILILIIQATFIISEGGQGLILQFGKIERIVQEPGLYFKYPFIQELIPLDKRILAAESLPAEYITLDKKRLTVDTVARWKIEDPKRFYNAVGDPGSAIARLNETIFAGLRQEIANHDFKDFIRERREAIMKQVTEMTAERAKDWGIRVVDVRIKRVDLPEEVQASVFARMKAERERIAKGYRAEGEEQARKIRAEADKEKEIILAEAYAKSEALRGEGDAQATAVYAEAYGKDEEFYSFVRHLEVYRKVFAAETTWLIKPESELLRFFDAVKGLPK